jgi:hypothetical protein
MTHPRWPLLAVSVLAATTVSALAQSPSPTPNSCFYINQFQSWRAPDPKTIYIRVNLNQYYRLDLAQECPALRWPMAHLITKTRGPDTVCTALDWDLSVADEPRGIPEPCIVKAMTPLSPQDVAAIPKKFKP